MRQTILLLQDRPWKAALVKDMLAESSKSRFVIEWIAGYERAVARLEDRAHGAIAAILMDLSLPGGRPLEIVEAVLRASHQTPLLLLASPEDEHIAKQAVRRGAQDYILDDPLDGPSLAKALHNMLERAAFAEALFAEKERAQVTLNSIGDAVVSTDVAGHVTYLNPVAATLAACVAAEALGRSFTDVIQIVDSEKPHRLRDPMREAIRLDRAVGLGAGSVLIRKDGTQAAIEDSAAPIHDSQGRVTGAVIVFRDVTHARAMSLRMSYLAHHDYLTGLPNRLLLDDRLAQAITTARRQHQELAVLFVDVDRFKHINDTHGHAIGDQLLLSVASRLTASVRESDTVSRQGGDEFVVLLSSIAHAEDAAFSANKILTALAVPHPTKGSDLHVTASIGIGVYPGDGNTAQTLVKHADIAMLNAKESGRNNYQFFKPAMNRHAVERQSLEDGLQHALDRHEYVLHFQPKMDLKTESITGAEALIRWKPPARRMVLPGKFIPIAEQSGYIVPIGRWVLREVCRQTVEWMHADLAPIPVAINVSPVELRSKDFVQGVRNVLKEAEVDPQWIEFELTETALLQDPSSTIGVLRSLKDMGIRLTLDDFGTGYSSLSYLKRFPIDSLKIDRTFVHGLCTNAGDAKIVSAIINMGKSFDLIVVAEGVETREQFQRLKMQQCSEGQGNYFHVPVAGKEFAKLRESDLSATVAAAQ